MHWCSSHCENTNKVPIAPHIAQPIPHLLGYRQCTFMELVLVARASEAQPSYGFLRGHGADYEARTTHQCGKHDFLDVLTVSHLNGYSQGL